MTNNPRQKILPCISSRTPHHPSYLPLYPAAGVADQPDSQIVHPIIPAEIFYTDPTLGCRGRIPNLPSGLRVFDCSQLNTPSPIMSARLAPPNRPDPFRSGPYPTRDLGSPTWRIRPTDPLLPPRRIVIQLTQEEDQAITNLLKLHHQESLQRDENFTAAQTSLYSVVEPPVNSNPSRSPYTSSLHFS